MSTSNDHQRNPRRVVTREQVVHGACRYFLRHGTIDMDELALQLAIGRATLYRVVHRRDEVLGEVLWKLGGAMLDRARLDRQQPGPDGVLEVTRLFVERLRKAKPFMAFLRAEPQTASRVLFSPSGGVHRRAVAKQREILVECGCGGDAALLDQRAYLYVRIAESVLYAELLGEGPLEPEIAERVAKALLTPTTAPR